VRTVRPADVQRVARMYFDPEDYVLATVGALE
jgi:predicted Zn-dependent peptidase